MHACFYGRIHTHTYTCTGTGWLEACGSGPSCLGTMLLNKQVASWAGPESLAFVVGSVGEGDGGVVGRHVSCTCLLAFVCAFVSCW